ncbi:phage tail tube protein [Nocardioides bruguierae]|uniref:phage tail tube protein n=1 Tax=Nocardioides bruguierae TaxID=2945102 RepID=UPI00202027BD|nr:hypothetical protein [Nocardioides bruguierae]MCL8026311.1 hypothetical protein [Nocardioides bruguierae]
MPKSLADGHMKLTLLTTKPVDEEAPTAAELNAGIDASCAILASDFTWTAADSDKIAEAALCDTLNVNALGRDNFTAGMTLFRYFDDTTKNADATEDAAFAATKTKGTELWGYLRVTGKEATEDWATDDEIELGLKVLTDNPQRPSNGGGYVKTRIPLEPQAGWPQIAVGAGA